MKEVGFFVPDSFDKLPDMINQAICSYFFNRLKGSQFRILAIEHLGTCMNHHESQVYTQLVMEGEIVETPEGETPQA